ncbi:MAG: TM0106 family RecB-like putative nuclease, partial [Candidatus Baltobacteraceae bacterium]
MQLIDGRYVYSASDLNNYLECKHLTELDRQVARGERTRPPRDAGTDLIARKGDEHERRYLERLRDLYGDGVVAFEERAENSTAGLLAAEAQTVAAMAQGAHLIYQATFFDGEFLGRADFLRRIEVPCERWAWSYEVIDTKLALSPKPYFLIQLCHYSEHLARIQGTTPRYGYIVLGSSEERRFTLSDYSAYYRHVKRSLLDSDSHAEPVEAPPKPQTYPLECTHCAICPWDVTCEKQRDDDDHLSIVAGMRGDQINKLQGAGITTLAQLACATAEQRPHKMSEVTFDYVRTQAAQQHLHRQAKRNGDGIKHFYKFRPQADDLSGFAKLPEPAAGDVFFDIEGDPLYRADRGLEYLWGVYVPPCHPEGIEGAYRAFWAKEPAQEQKAFEDFVDFVVERRKQYPKMHVYHYAAYEVSVLKRLMGRFASREREVDDFLRQGVFIDLYPVVRQGMWISQPSYSIKKVEAFYGLKRSTQTKGGDDSIVMFESWLASGDDRILEDIRAYNEDDCRSTYQLREWLTHLRQELNATLQAPIAWRPDPQVKPAEDDTRTELEHALLDNLPGPDSLQDLRNWSEPLRARWLLGNLLQYHRREAKPEWWKYFDRCKNPEDLLEFDDEAIAGLEWSCGVAPYKVKPTDRNSVYTYTFPPQEHRLGRKPHDPYTEKSAGDIVALDGAARRLQIKLAGGLEPSQLRALIPGTPIATVKKRKALETITSAYLSGNLETQFAATAGILLNRPPVLNDRPIGSTVQPEVVSIESVTATVRALNNSHLFVQGPPGSGKSTIGAAVIVNLIADGKRVGIVANSHKAVHNLLRKVEETAKVRALRFNGCHKETDTDGSTYEPYAEWPLMQSVQDIEELTAQGCQLAAGTTFAWADERLVAQFDYLFVDEAGQVSLADALVASLAAKNVVLLGDPQQLPQVSQGSHPVGCDLSVLQHLLADADTVAPERGLFLDKTYRMHPSICAFLSNAVYDGRLANDARTCNNAVSSPGLSGGGLVYVPVDHAGNGRRSDEEADRIVREVTLLLQGNVTVSGHSRRPMTERDILIVAPYNLQRLRIQELLRAAGLEGVKVGTVDKFQGQEAPVVFYSMATSSHSDMPRGIEFLFDRNRFNVAISRAQCMSVLVCSPRLLDARCPKPEAMALVNLLCAYAESALP